MTDVIHTMRTYFLSGGHVVGPAFFAQSVLDAAKDGIRRQARDVGLIPAELLGVLGVELRDPTDPVIEAPLTAYVNASGWKVKCECGGVERVDPIEPITMCCACWNAKYDHRWRPVLMPTEREEIEAVLLERPDPLTRHWRPTESVDDLRAENAKRLQEASV